MPPGILFSRMSSTLPCLGDPGCQIGLEQTLGYGCVGNWEILMAGSPNER